MAAAVAGVQHQDLHQVLLPQEAHFHLGQVQALRNDIPAAGKLQFKEVLLLV